MPEPFEIKVKKRTKKGANVSLVIDLDKNEVSFHTANSSETRTLVKGRGDLFLTIWMAFWYELEQLPHETKKAMMKTLNTWISETVNGH